MHTRGGVPLAGARGDDHGFGMMEAIVSMALFTVLVTVSLGLILRVTHVTGTNSRRVVAANLANRQIESVKGQKAIDIPDGGSTYTKTVGQITYTIRQTANYLPADATSSVCESSGSQLAYKLVSVSITWPEMGNVRPVRADTLKAVGVGSTGGLDAAKGAIALAVVGGAGADTADIPVTLSPGGATVTTGDDGCAVFVGLTPGAYTATADRSGYVGVGNAQVTAVNGLGVTAGGITRGTLVYDVARTVDLAPSGPVGYTLPAGIGLHLRNSYVENLTPPACSAAGQGCLTGFPGQARNLFPEIYEVWAGDCSDSLVPHAFDLTSADAEVGVPMGSALITVTKTTWGWPVPTTTEVADRPLYALHAPETPGTLSCGTGQTLTLPTSRIGGVGVLLPFGTWTISLSPHGGPVTSTVTLTGGGPTATVNLVTPW
jgi:Tfp pilus assembly protein PilV